MKLVDQWGALERRLPGDWETVALRLRTEQPAELPEAARILGPMNVGRAGDRLAITVRRAGGAAGPEAARRLFGRLDDARIWCILEQEGVGVHDVDPAAAAEPPAEPVVASWDAALGELPAGWSDLLCRLELGSSALLPRAALLCAPLNPTREPGRVAFTFRCASRTGYGVSPEMARRCFERLDDEAIDGRVTVLRVLSDAHNVATQGAVWYVAGKAL
ncbi:MAG TPA: hypothetical protein VHR46_09540 [Gaiella sp.]|nr:hypothetical protein [Gaiella sp.]